MKLDKFDFSFNTDAMQQDLDRVETKPGGSNQKNSDKYVIFPKGEGVIAVRILPADTPNGQEMPYHSTRLHYINDRSYHCLREKDGKYWSKGICPICNYYNFLYKMAKQAATKDDADAIVAVARDIKPIERHYYNCIVREEVHSETKETVENVGPKILGIGKSLHGRILRACLGNVARKQKPLGNIMHPMTGRDFTIIKTERVGHNGQKFPNYDESRFEEESILGADKQIKEWLDQMWDLSAERIDNLKLEEELQHQVDIFQGKIEDDSLGFDPSQLNLPSDLKLSSGTKTQVRVDKPVVPETTETTEAPSETAAVSDVPFNFDLDSPGVEADWAKELQAQINIDG